MVFYMSDIYLDYQAAKPVDRRVLEEMIPYFSDIYGNPASLHNIGDKATEMLEESREKIFRRSLKREKLIPGMYISISSPMIPIREDQLFFLRHKNVTINIIFIPPEWLDWILGFTIINMKLKIHLIKSQELTRTVHTPSSILNWLERATY